MKNIITTFVLFIAIIITVNAQYCENFYFWDIYPPLKSLAIGQQEVQLPHDRYADLTERKIYVEQGELTKFELEAIAHIQTGYYYKIWLDENKDYEFSNSELMATFGMGIRPNLNILDETITIPLLHPGDYRLRIQMFDPYHREFQPSVINAAACYDGNYLNQIIDLTLSVSGYCVPVGTTYQQIPYTSQYNRTGIAKIIVGDFQHENGYIGNNDNNQTHQMIALDKGATTDVVLVGANNTANFNFIQSQRWLVYVDWNQDGDFLDPAERVLHRNGSYFPVVVSNLRVPTTARTGITRMRVVYANNTPFIAPCYNNFFGEAQDFSVLVRDLTEPCVPYHQNTDISWLESVKINDLVYADGLADSYAAGNDLIMAADKNEGIEIEVTARSIYTAATNNEPQIKVWLDYNQDGEFHPYDELVAEQTADFYQTNRITIEPNAQMQNGLTKIRVQVLDTRDADFYNSSSSVCGQLFAGETEDYTIDFFGQNTYCTAAGIPTEGYIESMQISSFLDEIITQSPAENGYHQFMDAIMVEKESMVGLFYNPVYNEAFVQELVYIAYADFNQNQIFDDNEMVYNSWWNGGDYFTPPAFYVSNDVPTGEVRLRFIMSLEGVVDACATEFLGEVEDYTLNIVENLQENNVNNRSIATDSHSAAPDSKLSVFPNPATDFSTIEIQFTKATSAQLQIFNSTGQLIQQMNLGKIMEVNEQVNWTQQVTGTYFVIVKTSQQTYQQAVIVH